MSNSSASELEKAVPLDERSRMPDNKPAVHEHQQGHIPFADGEIDYDLWEVLQKPYVNGTGKEKGANLRIPYFPSGFTVGTVLFGDFHEVSDADEDVEGEDRPVKTAVYVEFCDSTYSSEAVHMKQRRMPQTRGKFAAFVAEEIHKIIDGLPDFPYTVHQIKVLSIDVRSRGTVQPRIFVTSAVKQAQVQE